MSSVTTNALEVHDMVNMKKRYAGALLFPVFFIIVISSLLVQCDIISQLIGSAPNLTSIDITPADPEIEIGTILQFSATGFHDDGSMRLLLPGEVTWSLSDTIIATVSTLGLATGTSPGSTIITATSATLSYVSGSTMLTIIEQPPDPEITVTYTVTYNSNGASSGSAPTDSAAYRNGWSVTVLSNTGSMARSGYTFAGWNTALDGSGTQQATGSTFTMGSDNVTLYAKWEASVAQKIMASDAQALDEFGASAAISGDYVVVGAYGEDAGGGEAGAAYIFHRTGTTWDAGVKIVATDPQAYDEFGKSVAISGNYAVVGAYGESAGGSYAGAAYIFHR